MDITFFGRSAEVANQYLRKGSKVLVEGRLKLDTWTDNNTGQKKSKHSVVVESMQMLGSKEESSGSSFQNGTNSQQQGGYAPQGQQYQQPQQQAQQAQQGQQQPQQYQQPAQTYQAPHGNVPVYNENVQQPAPNTQPTDISEDEIPF